MTISQLEQRLRAVERELAELKLQRNRPVRPAHPVDAIDRIHGTFEDDDAFRDAMRLGREWRDSDLPKPSRRRGKSAPVKPKRK
jgi:hypothetical protein